MKWIPRSKSGASKPRPRWAAHTRIGNVWEYPPPPRGARQANSNVLKITVSDRIQISSKTTYKDTGTKENTSCYFIS